MSDLDEAILNSKMAMKDLKMSMKNFKSVVKDIKERSSDCGIPQSVVDELTTQKNQAYNERNILVAGLSKIFPAFLSWHYPEDEDWDPEWKWIVYITLPTGQVSWHIHETELSMFSHLEHRRRGNYWDGHTTQEKYERVKRLQPRLDDELLRSAVEKRTEEIKRFYAQRIQRLREVCETHGLLHEWASIVSAGTAVWTEPHPMYHLIFERQENQIRELKDGLYKEHEENKSKELALGIMNGRR